MKYLPWVHTLALSRSGGALRVACLAGLFAAIVGLPMQPAEAATPAGAPAAQDSGNLGAMNLPTPYGRHTDDLKGMLQRQNIRALVLINPTGFFFDNGQPGGVNYEALRDFESFVNQKLKTGALKVKVTFIPLRPDQLEAALTQGVGDVIAFPLVITPERRQ